MGRPAFTILARAATGGLVAAGLVVAGCLPFATLDRRQVAEDVAVPAGLARVPVAAGPFTLIAYERVGAPGAPLTVYVEGDGLAWTRRTRPSSDPTPIDPVALRLAAVDRSANVAYLARPCQYVDLSRQPACRPALWTGARFAEEVVAATDAAVSALKARAAAGTVHLVGFSGGAAVAALVAARRSDVASLRTVAGNLDPGQVNRFHRVSPLAGSLDPLAVAARLARVPQRHFVGADDDVVPSGVAAAFVAAQGHGGACARIERVDGAGHQDGWAERWPRLLEREVTCH